MLRVGALAILPVVLDRVASKGAPEAATILRRTSLARIGGSCTLPNAELTGAGFPGCSQASARPTGEAGRRAVSGVRLSAGRGRIASSGPGRPRRTRLMVLASGAGRRMRGVGRA